MRTRRSWRNQDRLWKLLTPPAPPKQHLESPNRCCDCRHYPKGGRSRGTCSLHSEKVYGLSERNCFESRPPTAAQARRRKP